MYRNACQPASWKIANAVPIFKKNSKSLPNNYRLVSLLPIISKIMERIINEALTNFLEKHSVLSNRQFGFRSGLGTSDLLVSLYYQWSRTANQGGLVRVLAIDIAGAFHKVSHRGVLHAYGARGRHYSLLESYLKDRQLRAAVNGHLSTAYPVGSGVPQGSILRLTLFLLYVNDAEDTLPRGADLAAAYVDDTTLYKCVSTKGDVDTDAETLQAAVSALAEWGNTWHIKFEPAKSQALTISHHRSPIEVPAINFQGTVVPQVAELRLLGIMFDKDLSFRTHIRQLNIRGTQRLGFLRKAAAVLGPAGCVTAYKGFVRPVLEYGMLTWMGASQTSLRQLANVQRRALHVIGPGSFLPSLEVRRAVAALCFLYRLHYLPGPAILTRLLPPPALLPQRETRMQLAFHHNLNY